MSLDRQVAPSQPRLADQATQNAGIQAAGSE
jgi:hypothetical protein